MRARHVIVRGVVTALAVLLPHTQAPGVVLGNHAVGVRTVEIIVQGAGLFDLVAGLPISKAGEIVVGTECGSARAENGECQQQFFDSSHG
ncbi:hypothetical protein D3C81_1569160 [compost metagenome]